MTAASQAQKPHSADYFGESRDHWWNADFLHLVGDRLGLRRAKHVLDVGCGVGHWGRVLAPILAADARVTGIDREPRWVAEAAARAEALGLGGRFRYQQGDAAALPFADGTFDLVTCQTVLIHLNDPRQALREMLRVLRPGGTLFVTEPNNFANCAIGSSLTERLSVDEVVDRLRFELLVQRGKQALGLGFNSVGDRVPGYLAEVGAENVRVFLSDKPQPFVPPYATEGEQASLAEMREWAARGFTGWDREEMLAYFLAGGGRADEFERYHELRLRDLKETIGAIDSGTFHSAGGVVMYLVAATRPAA
ncbi:class I SAM-dependent methyltransferase [Vulgatibacter sp.]|uniref:class I SAM-dependent methyltransferase n=1 Tax=Vulgatibacter sp. TaxID=1971226 RepID=UPI0035691C3C